MRRLVRGCALIAAAVGLFAVLVVQAPGASANTSGNVCNVSSGTGIGMIHNNDGIYTHGTYDALLQPGACTKNVFPTWTSVAGFWIGDGYCVFVSYDTGPVDKDFGPHTFWFPTPDTHVYFLKATRACT